MTRTQTCQHLSSCIRSGCHSAHLLGHQSGRMRQCRLDGAASAALLGAWPPPSISRWLFARSQSTQKKEDEEEDPRTAGSNPRECSNTGQVPNLHRKHLAPWSQTYELESTCPCRHRQNLTGALPLPVVEPGSCTRRSFGSARLRLREASCRHKQNVCVCASSKEELVTSASCRRGLVCPQ